MFPIYIQIIAKLQHDISHEEIKAIIKWWLELLDKCSQAWSLDL